MRIAIISHLKYPIGEPFAGGLEMHTYALVKGLRRKGHIVDLFARHDSDPELPIGPVALGALRHATPQPFERNRDHHSELFVREHHAYMDLMLRLAEGSYDIVHNNSLNYVPLSMAHTLPVPMVTTLHTPPFCWLQSGVLCERRHGKVRYVSVSEQNARNWRPFAKVHRTIRNGIDTERWRYCAYPEADHAVWFGRITPEKGTHLAVAAAHAAGLRISLAGPLSDPAYYEREVRPLLRDTDAYCGHLRHDALARLVGRGSVFLCTPRWEEPFGLVVAEALACGTPVAAFARGAMPELLTPATGRLAPADNVDALATAARQAQTLRRADCRRWAEAHGSVDRMIDEYEQLYHALIRPAVWPVAG